MAGLLDKVLDMSLAARMERARDMGFDTAKRWYHGTRAKADFSEFDSSAIRDWENRRTAIDKGISLSSDPKWASGYANDDGGRVLPLLERHTKAWHASSPEAVQDAKLAFMSKYGHDARSVENWPFYEERIKTGHWFGLEGLLDELHKDFGYDAFFVNEAGANNLIVMKPEQVRSIHAAFDPARASSSDLLAGAAPWAMAGGLGLLAGAMPGESRADKLAREMTHREPSRNVSGLERLQAGLQAGGATPVPVASDVMGLLGDALMYYNDPSSRTWTNYGGTALGLLPFVP